MKSGKQRYYAALEHEENAGRLLGRRREEEADAARPAGEDELFVDLGMRVYRAFTNVLDSLGDMAGRAAAGRDEVSEQSIRRGMEPVLEELRQIRHKLEQHEMYLHEVSAGIRRIDKFTLEAFQRLNAAEAAYGSRAYGEPQPGRLSKEETTERALQAARELMDSGERLTLKAVARKAGLRYAQVVYAFGRKEELLNRLEDETKTEQKAKTAGDADEWSA